MAHQATDDDPQTSGDEFDDTSEIASDNPQYGFSEPDSFDSSVETSTSDDEYNSYRSDISYGDEDDGLGHQDSSNRVYASKQVFTKFPQLPTEIRRIIWKFATPSPRTIDFAILAIIDFNLAQPRAILTRRSQASWTWKNCDGFSMLMSVLHCSHESRAAALCTYHLDLDSSIIGEDKPWFKPEDTVYFPVMEPKRFYTRAYFYDWIKAARKKPCSQLASIRHLALDVSSLVTPDNYSRSPHHKMNLRWLLSFPDLESLDILSDPTGRRHLDHGSLILYEAEEVLLTDYEALTPSGMEQMATKQIGQALAKSGRDAPVIEFSVVCWKPPTLRKRKVG